MTANVILRSRLDAMLMAVLISPEYSSIHFRFLAGDPLSPTNSSAKGPISIKGLQVDVQWLGRPLSSIYSTARTLLAVRHEPVALVLDAGATDPDTVSERRQSIEEVIGETASRAQFLPLVAVPALQSLLFTRPALIARVFGEGADQYGHIADIGRLIPREAYKRLDPAQSETSVATRLIEALDDEDVATLREDSLVRELIAFVTEVGSPVASASAAP
jgi:hypothetical protein